MIIKKSTINNVIQLMLLCLIFSASAIRMYNNYVVESDTIDIAIKYGLICLSIMFLGLNNLKLSKPLIFEIFMVVVVLISYLIFSDNRPYIQATFNDYWTYILVLFLCVYNADYKTIEKSMIISAYIIFAFDILLFMSPNYYRLFVEYGYGGVGAVFSYSLLFPAVVFLYLFKKHGVKLYLAPSFVAAFLIAFYGSNRTATLCYLIYLSYVIFFDGGKIDIKTVIKTICFVLIGMTLLLNLSSILSFIAQLIGKGGYSSRIIEQFFNGSLAGNSGRSELRQQLFAKIFSFEGFLGFGINGDRVITSTHEYAHNIFLELLIEFGWLMGTIAIILLLSLAYKTIKKKTRFNNIIGILFAIKVIALMVSGTFWNDIYFWMFISICIRVLFKNEECYFVDDAEIMIE